MFLANINQAQHVLTDLTPPLQMSDIASFPVALDYPVPQNKLLEGGLLAGGYRVVPAALMGSAGTARYPDDEPGTLEARDPELYEVRASLTTSGHSQIDYVFMLVLIAPVWLTVFLLVVVILLMLWCSLFGRC